MQCTSIFFLCVSEKDYNINKDAVVKLKREKLKFKNFVNCYLNTNFSVLTFQNVTLHCFSKYSIVLQPLSRHQNINRYKKFIDTSYFFIKWGRVKRSAVYLHCNHSDRKYDHNKYILTIV